MVAMKLFEKKFYSSMSSKVALLNRITHYIVNRKGKQMRPMFVFLVSKMVSDGIVNERTYRGASVIELIHTATLVHDDVVDDANYRRGFFSINALWKNKIAVLVGDYFLSKGMLVCIDNNDFDLLKIISVAVREIVEGELLQIEKARKLDIKEEVYFVCLGIYLILKFFLMDSTSASKFMAIFLKTCGLSAWSQCPAPIMIFKSESGNRARISSLWEA